MTQALGAGTMTIESLIFHVSGKSKDDVLRVWTGMEKDALGKMLACKAEFDRWLSRKEAGRCVRSRVRIAVDTGREY